MAAAGRRAQGYRSNQGGLDVFNTTGTDGGNTTQHALRFVDNRAPRPERFSVRDLIEEIRAIHAQRLAAQRIEVEINVPLGESIHADRAMFRECILNLVQNSLEAMPCGGCLVITSYKGPSAFELEVADSGTGLAGEIRKRAFEPHFTTKHGAAGMGLSIVRRVADAHGGQVLVHNCPEGGAAFTIRIPLRAWEVAA